MSGTGLPSYMTNPLHRVKAGSHLLGLGEGAVHEWQIAVDLQKDSESKVCLVFLQNLKWYWRYDKSTYFYEVKIQ